MAEDIINYAYQHKIDKFTICGHSMGGKVAMAVAALYPEKIHGLIVLDSPPKDVNDDKIYVPGMRDAVFFSKVIEKR